MYVVEYCKKVYNERIPIKVTVSKDGKKSTKELYIVGYNGEYNGTNRDYILFRDTYLDLDTSVWRTFYMKDVQSFSSDDNWIHFNEGVLPYEINGEPFVSR